jgi:hypothetical protein
LYGHGVSPLYRRFRIEVRAYDPVEGFVQRPLQGTPEKELRKSNSGRRA